MDRSEQIEFFHYVDRFLRGVDDLKESVRKLEKLIDELHYENDCERS